MSLDTRIRDFVTAVANKFNSERTYNLNAALQGVATAIGSKVGPIWDALAANFGLIDGYDVRLYGAVGNGSTDDTAAIQAAINAAAPNGIVKVPGRRVYRITSSLFVNDNVEIVGGGAKSSEFRTATDIACFRMLGGQAQALRGLMIRSTVTSSRTTFDIDSVNPTKVVLQDIEINLPNGVNGDGGGVRFRRDDGMEGTWNAFMPQLDRVWIRNGHLVTDRVTDGHVMNSYIWGSSGNNRLGAVNLLSSNGWSFATTDVVPTQSSIGGSGYYIANTIHTNINGGYVDGSYTSNITGYGIHAVNSGQIFMAGTHIYHPGRSAILLENTVGCSFSAVGIQRANKADAGYPDIQLLGSSDNTFLGTNHSRPAAHTNPGPIYIEDGNSNNNFFDAATIDRTQGNNYRSPLFEGKASTMGPNNRPGSLWPRPAAAPNFLVPPACLYGGNVVAWPLGNRAQFHRFYVETGAVYQFTSLRPEAGTNANVQAAIVRMNGLSWTRVTNAGAAVVTGAGHISIDMGPRYLEPGEYALVLWSDSTTLQVRAADGDWLRSTRIVGEQTLVGGIPESGTLASWSTARAIQGLTITTSNVR
ncbi:hydrolase [Microbacterium Phage DejaVu]|nr:hydrolase [Microbacterium phage Lupine]QDH92192.1 hydrolase [Microbacterium phage PhillyPhilly]QDK03284.1 hydrolase [Microbacterium phage Roman]UVG34097.1 hydrolase [Microbacterium phage Pavlo]WNM66175.1 hydrolase [Microbacterium Phage DejaVu]